MNSGPWAHPAFAGQERVTDTVFTRTQRRKLLAGFGKGLVGLGVAVTLLAGSVFAEQASVSGAEGGKSSLTASEADTEATSALIGALSKMQQFKANFVQLTQDAEGTILQEIKGRVHLSRPQRFHWQIMAPYQQTLVVQSEKLWIVDDDLEQVTVQSLSAQVGLTPAILLSGDPTQIQAHYTVSMKSLSNGAQQFVLRPQGEEALFDQLTVVLDQGTLQEMDFRDTLGQRTAINFSQVQLNKAFDEAIFAVSVPEDYDFIEDY